MSNEYNDWLMDRAVSVAVLLPKYRDIILELVKYDVEPENKFIIEDINQRLKSVFNYYDLAIKSFYKRDWDRHLLPLLHSMEFLVADTFMKFEELANSNNKDFADKISNIIVETMELYDRDELISILEQDEQEFD